MLRWRGCGGCRVRAGMRGYALHWPRAWSLVSIVQWHAVTLECRVCQGRPVPGIGVQAAGPIECMPSRLNCGPSNACTCLACVIYLVY